MSASISQSLEKFLPESAFVKSSHWRSHTKDFDTNAKNLGIDGFGQVFNRSAVNRVWNYAWQRLLHFGDSVFASPHYRSMQQLCKKQGRTLSMDSLRHVFTHRLLDQLVPDAKVYCVIGDGMSHFVGPRLLSGQKVISINLPEVLISDSNLLERAGLIGETNTAVCSDHAEVVSALGNPSVHLILVPASKADAVRGAGVDLFVNIASFQEMTEELVAGYFDIIRSNRPTHFYCCNREEKVLYGGERLVFDDYPWSDHQVILAGDCPWHQRFYSKKPPFVLRYDGNVKHALVRYA